MGKPLGIPLGIDFGAIDRDLNQVADRIEATGKKIKLGVDIGDMKGAGVDFGDIGDRMATGIASGIRSSSGLMLQLGTNMNAMLDRFTGAAITTFKRIDASIKFPMWDAFFRGSAAKLANFSAFWKKPLSDIDLAMAGAFGSMVGNITRVFKELAASIVAEFAKVQAAIVRTEADASGLFATAQKAATAANRFQMGTAGLATGVPGPRIGAATQFLKPPDPAPLRMYGYELKAIEGTTADVLMMYDVMVRTLAAPFTLAASAALGTIGALRRVGNVLSSIGPVTKKTFGDMFNSMMRISTLGFVPNAIESAKQFNRTLTSSNSLVGRLTGSIGTLGTAILAAFGVVGVIYKTVQFLVGGVKAASDLNTAVERSRIVFGSSFGVVEEQAKRNNEQFRISKQEQLDMAAGFGAIAQGAGMSEQASAGFANQMTKMAINLKASGAAESFQEAGDAIKSGLTGRGMELKQLGAVMDEDAVKAYSLAKGYRKAGEEMGRSDTLMTRAELVMRGLSFAQGALERNAGTSAAAFAKAGGGVQEFATQAGQLLLPAITTLTDAFNTLMGSTLTFFETNKAAIAGWAETIKQKIEFVGVVVRNLDIVWEMTQLQFGMHIENIIRYADTLPENFGRIFDWLRNNWLNILTDIGAMIAQFVANVTTNFLDIGQAIAGFMTTGEFKFNFTPLLDEFKATTEALPEMLKPALVNVDAQIKELGDKIAGREADRLAGLDAKAGDIPDKPGDLPELGKDKKGADYKLSSAAEINSKEAASIIARSQTAGIGKGDKVVEHLKVAKDSHETLQSINNKLGTGTQRLVVKNGR